MPARCISACARTLAKAGGFEMRAAKPIRLRPRETEAHPGAPKNGNKPTGEDERDDGCLHADTGDDKTDRGQHINYAVEGLIFIELVELKLREGLNQVSQERNELRRHVCAGRGTASAKFRRRRQCPRIG